MFPGSLYKKETKEGNQGRKPRKETKEGNQGFLQPSFQRGVSSNLYFAESLVLLIFTISTLEDDSPYINKHE
jgi:hypothetical protein